MLNEGKEHASVEPRLRTMRIMWAAFLMTIGILAVVAFVSRQAVNSDAGDENDALFLILLFVAVSSVLASFVAKQVFFKRAVAERRLDLVQAGLIVALALCEAAVFLGLVTHFVTGHRYSFLMFVLGAVGELAHFPRREQLLAAVYKDVT